MSGAIDTLARTIWGEARGEGYVGMAAVAMVVMNRAARPGWWGRDVASCCTAAWQFSCWNEGDPNRALLLAVDASDPQFAQAMEIAERTVSGAMGGDSTNRADSYYAAGSREPDWAYGLDPCAVIGHHRFYRAASSPAQATGPLPIGRLAQACGAGMADRADCVN